MRKPTDTIEENCPGSQCYRVCHRARPSIQYWYGAEWRRGKPKIRFAFATRTAAVAWAKAAHEPNRCHCEKT